MFNKVFKNLYFWAGAAAVFLIGYGLVMSYFFFYGSSATKTTASTENLLESRSRNTTRAAEAKETVAAAEPSAKKKNGSTGNLAKTRAQLLKLNKRPSGWVDQDDGKVTIVLKFDNLRAEVISEIIADKSFAAEIDGTEAQITAAEPFRNTALLMRISAILDADKFDAFKSGKTTAIRVGATLSCRDEQKDFTFAGSFVKTASVSGEGVRVKWR